MSAEDIHTGGYGFSMRPGISCLCAFDAEWNLVHMMNNLCLNQIDSSCDAM